MKMQNFNPLVSIVVVTYNSSEFVIETLESAKQQTYENIELIISDDFSTDNTIEICKIWVEKNKNRFINTSIITTDKNTGISPNANRGFKASNGEWIKFIAGDDMLMENCIEELVKHIEINKSFPITFLVHGIVPFRKDSEFNVVYPPEKFINSDAYGQLIYLLRRGNSVSGSAFFLERTTFEKFGGFDERFNLFEDFPLLIKYTKNNQRIWLIKKPLFKYRIHSSNLSFDRSFLLKESFIRFKNEILFPLFLEHRLYLIYWHRFLQGKTKYRFFWGGLLLLSPVGWQNRIYKMFGRSYFYNHKLEFQKKK